MNIDITLRPRRFYWFSYTGGFFALLSFSNPFLLVVVAILSTLAYKAYKDGTCISKDLKLNSINEFSTDEHYKLQRDYYSITSFDDVARWDSEAKLQIVEIQKYCQLLTDYKKYLQSKLVEYERERLAGKFSETILGYHTKERVVSKILSEVNKVDHAYLIINLKEQIEFSPNNIDEKKAILEKLAHLKENLNEQKKDIMDNKRNVRENAKNKNAEISNRFFSSPQSRRFDRQANRSEKEEALAHLEIVKNQLISQVAFVDRQIAWVKQISGKQKAVSGSDISATDKTKFKAS
jgi:hypothetical protein